MGEATGLSNSEARDLCVTNSGTRSKDWIMQQTMYRIKDPRKSLPFYTGVLGMKLLQKLDFPEMKFSLYFMGYEKAEDVPTDKREAIEWTFSRKATIELTQYVSRLFFFIFCSSQYVFNFYLIFYTMKSNKKK